MPSVRTQPVSASSRHSNAVARGAPPASPAASTTVTAVSPRSTDAVSAFERSRGAAPGVTGRRSDASGVSPLGARAAALAGRDASSGLPARAVAPRVVSAAERRFGATELSSKAFRLPEWDHRLDWSDAKALLARVKADGVVDAAEVKAVFEGLAHVVLVSGIELGRRENVGGLNLLMGTLHAAAPDVLPTSHYQSADGSVRWSEMLSDAALQLRGTGEDLVSLEGAELLSRLQETVGATRSVRFTSAQHGDGGLFRLEYETVPFDGFSYSLATVAKRVDAVERELSSSRVVRRAMLDGELAGSVFVRAMRQLDLALADRALARIEALGDGLAPPEGLTLLDNAVRTAGGSRFVERLLKLGADPSLSDRDVPVWLGTRVLPEFIDHSGGSFTALHQAAFLEGSGSPTAPDEAERLRNIETLLRYGADPRLETAGVGYEETGGGATPLLFVTAWRGEERLRAAELLLSAGADPNFVSEKGTYLGDRTNVSFPETPTLVAMRRGDTELSELLRRRGGIPFDHDAERRAAWGAHGSELEALLARADVRHDVVATEYSFRRDQRASYEPAETTYLELLRAGLDPAARVLGRKGVEEPLLSFAALTAAAWDEDLLRKLTAAGLDINMAGPDGWNALHRTIFDGRVAPIETLLRCGADLHAKTEDGTDALMLACFARQPAVALRLLEAGADVTTQNDGGRTALFYALAGSGDKYQRANGLPTDLQLVPRVGALTEVVKELIKRGADPNVPVEEHGGLPLWAAILAQQAAPAGLSGEGRISPDALLALLQAPTLKVDLADPRIQRVLADAKQQPELRHFAEALLARPGPIAADPVIEHTGAQDGVIARRGVDVYRYEEGKLYLNAEERYPVRGGSYGVVVQLDNSHVFGAGKYLAFVPRFTEAELATIKAQYRSERFASHRDFVARHPELAARITRGSYLYDLDKNEWHFFETNPRGRRSPPAEHRELFERMDAAAKPLDDVRVAVG